MKIGKIERNEYPIGLIVDLHDYCNARCKMCPYDSLKDKIHHGFMDLSLYTKIIDDFSCLMRDYNFQGVLTYCNMGEPFILDNLEFFTKYAEERGIWVYLNTNANLMTPEKVNKLIDAGFKGAFNISFHAATPEVYKDIMGLEIEKTKRNIEYLIQRYPKERISFNILNYHWPRGEEEKLRYLLSSWGFETYVNFPISRGGLVPLRRRYVKRLAGCGPDRVLYQMVVCHNGEVLLCCNDMGRREIVGNLREKTIHEVWNGDKFRLYLEQIYLGKPSHPYMICHSCDESVSFWSLRRIIKSIIPLRVIKRIRGKRETRWGIGRRIQ